MRIRRANDKDAFQIATVHVKSWHETYSGIVDQQYLDGLSEEQRFKLWKKTLGETYGQAPVFVAENDQGEIIAFASFGKERSALERLSSVSL